MISQTIVDRVKQELYCSVIVPEFEAAPNHMICCVNPAHQGEKNASQKWYPENNTHYCFGCNTPGDVLDLIEWVHSIHDFWDKVKYGAERLGLKIDDKKMTPEIQAEYEYFKQRHRLLTDIANLCHQKLFDARSIDAEQAMAYLKSRCFKEEAIRELKIGLFDGKKIQKKITINDLELAGLAKKGEPILQGYCLFFPIFKGGTVVNAQLRQIPKINND